MQQICKGGILSEDIGGFLPLPKNIPKNCLQLSYPVHGNDKILILNNILQVKKYYIFKKLKNANDTAYVECVKFFTHIGSCIMLLEPICRICK